MAICMKLKIKIINIKDIKDNKNKQNERHFAFLFLSYEKSYLSSVIIASENLQITTYYLRVRKVSICSGKIEQCYEAVCYPRVAAIFSFYFSFRK